MDSANVPSRPKRPKFSTSRRGFEKDQVEAYLDEMSVSHDNLASSAALAERRLTDATARLEEAEFRLDETNARVADLESQIEAAGEAGLGSSGDSGENMNAILARAEAEELVASARAESEDAAARSVELVARAEAEAEELVASARAESEDAAARSVDLIGKAEDEAEEIGAEARTGLLSERDDVLARRAQIAAGEDALAMEREAFEVEKGSFKAQSRQLEKARAETKQASELIERKRGILAEAEEAFVAERTLLQ